MLKKEGVADVLEIKLEDVREEDKVSFTTKDAKARYTIVQSISDKYVRIIQNAKTAREMMELLANLFERKSPLMKIVIVQTSIK